MPTPLFRASGLHGLVGRACSSDGSRLQRSQEPNGEDYRQKTDYPESMVQKLPLVLLAPKVKLQSTCGPAEQQNDTQCH